MEKATAAAAGQARLRCPAGVAAAAGFTAWFLATRRTAYGARLRLPGGLHVAMVEGAAWGRKRAKQFRLSLTDREVVLSSSVIEEVMMVQRLLPSRPRGGGTNALRVHARRPVTFSLLS
jgi:hypothetical protein